MRNDDVIEMGLAQASAFEVCGFIGSRIERIKAI